MRSTITVGFAGIQHRTSALPGLGEERGAAGGARAGSGDRQFIDGPASDLIRRSILGSLNVWPPLNLAKIVDMTGGISVVPVGLAIDFYRYGIAFLQPTDSILYQILPALDARLDEPISATRILLNQAKHSSIERLIGRFSRNDDSAALWFPVHLEVDTLNLIAEGLQRLSILRR